MLVLKLMPDPRGGNPMKTITAYDNPALNSRDYEIMEAHELPLMFYFVLHRLYRQGERGIR